MDSRFIANVVTTTTTAKVDNSGDDARAFNISATATYTDGALNQISSGTCTPVDTGEGEPVGPSTFSQYGQLSVNFGNQSDPAEVLAAIRDFITGIAAL